MKLLIKESRTVYGNIRLEDGVEREASIRFRKGDILVVDTKSCNPDFNFLAVSVYLHADHIFPQFVFGYSRKLGYWLEYIES